MNNLQYAELDVDIGDNRNGAEIPCIFATTVLTVTPRTVRIHRPGCPDIVYRKQSSERVVFSFQDIATEQIHED